MSKATAQKLFGKPVLVSGSLVEAGEFVPPASIEWMPAGSSTINVGRANGEVIELSVVTDEALAADLDEELQALIAAAAEGKASRPYIDFDHDGGKAAAIPTKFFWEDGIRLALDWTPAGLAAIEGREYSYFSPTWHQDETADRPDSLPSHGAIGALVNTPAFQTIERIAASHSPKNQAKTMWTDEIIATLVTLGVISQEDADNHVAEKAIDRLKETHQHVATLTEERDTLKAQVTELETDIETRRTEAVETSVDAAIEAGQLAKDSRETYVTACLAAKDDGKALLAGLPKPTQSKSSPPVKFDGKAGETIRAQYEAITDPAEKTKFFRAHKAELLAR